MHRRTAAMERRSYCPSPQTPQTLLSYALPKTQLQVASKGPFFRALQDLGEMHDREVQALREQLEAACKRGPGKAPELEQLGRPVRESCQVRRPWESGSCVGVEEAAVSTRSRESRTSVCEDLPIRQMSKNRWSTNTEQTENKMLTDDMELVKSWRSVDVSRMTSIHESRAFKMKLPACSGIVGHQAFDAVCSLMIIGNAVLMGVAADWKVQNYREDRIPETLRMLDRVFTCWFLLELLLRIMGHGLEFFFHAKHWSWNLFDLCVVTVDVVNMLIDLSSSEASTAGGDLSVVRLLRVLRITRALLIVRIFRFFRELRMMVFSVLRSGTSLAWSLVLFFLDLFLFSVFFTGQITAYKKDLSQQDAFDGDWGPIDTYFGNMTRAIYTLFMSVSGGIGWGEVSRPLQEVHWSNSLLFTFFIFFTVFALTNIITGIFVDTAILSAQSDRDEVIQTQLHNRYATLREMQEIFEEADMDKVGAITLQELEDHLNNTRIRAHMEALGLQLDEARGLFKLLDVNKSGTVTIDEFIFGCMRLKGTARSIDLATLMYENKKMSSLIATFFQYVEQEFQKLQPCLAAMGNQYASRTSSGWLGSEEPTSPTAKQAL